MPTLSARTPAWSRAGLSVRSRWSKAWASERNSASIIAPEEVRDVLERKRRLREVFSVRAVRMCWILCVKSWLVRRLGLMSWDIYLLLRVKDHNMGSY